MCVSNDPVSSLGCVVLNVKVIVTGLERVFGRTLTVVPGQFKETHDDMQLVVLAKIHSGQ